jgi:hypothetical protein
MLNNFQKNKGTCIQDSIQVFESGVFLEDQMKSVGSNTIKIQITYKDPSQRNSPVLCTTFLSFAICCRLFDNRKTPAPTSGKGRT